MIKWDLYGGDKYCPVCFKRPKYIESWESAKFNEYAGFLCEFKCYCGHIDICENFLNKEEALCTKRTKLIDEMTK